MLSLRTVLVLAVAPSLAFAGDLPTNVDFESGTLGWVGPTGPGGATTIVPTGGNGGGAGLQTVFNNFTVTFRNAANPAYVGDYSQFDSVTLSCDIRVNLINFFGSPVPRPWLVELRDYDLAQGGYPYTSVWYLYDDISVANNPSWTTYSVTIDDPASTTLPAGWGGYGDEHPTTFEPILPAGVTFADVLAGVDEIAFTSAQPGFFFGFTDFDLVLDNLSISTTGGPWTDLGHGLAGTNGVPRLRGYGDLSPGSPTSLGLVTAADNAPVFLGVGTSQIDLPFFGGVLVPNPNVAIVQLQVGPQGAMPFDFTWPSGLGSGTDLYWQMWVIDLAGPQGAVPSNGLRSTVP